MSPEQLIRLEALKLALAHRAMSTAEPVEAAKKYEAYISGQPPEGSGDTVKEPGAAAPKVRKIRSVETPAT